MLSPRLPRNGVLSNFDPTRMSRRLFMQEHPIITLWLLWVVAVPLGPLTGALARRRWRAITSRSLRILSRAAMLSISMSLLMIFTPWSLRGFWADAVNLALAYVAVWVLCSLPYRRAKWVGEHGRIVAGIPSALLAIFVYTMLPFLAVTDGMVPNSFQEVKPGLVARISQFGWETMNTDIVELVQRPRWFPVIEHSIYKWVNSNETCDLGKIRVYADPSSDSVVSTCLSNPHLYDRALVR